jgi:hypothetical protein
MRCLGTAISQCNKERWVTLEDCAATNRICSAENFVPSCVESTNCTTGNTRCNVDQTRVQECIDRSWVNGADCAGQGKDCITTSATSAQCQTPAPCTSGATRCQNNRVQTCVSGSWNVGENCGSKTCTEIDDVSAECVTCGLSSGNYTVCDGDDVVECDGRDRLGSLACNDLLGISRDGTCWAESDDAATCLMEPEERCAYPNNDGTITVMACGLNGDPQPDLGCHHEYGCGYLGGPCSPEDFEPSCFDGHLIFACLEHGPDLAQPLATDCLDIGGWPGECDEAAGVCRYTTNSFAPCEVGFIECKAGDCCGDDGFCGPCD